MKPYQVADFLTSQLEMNKKKTQDWRLNIFSPISEYLIEFAHERTKLRIRDLLCDSNPRSARSRIIIAS